MVMTFASEKEALIYLWHAGYIPWPNHLPRRGGQYAKLVEMSDGIFVIESIIYESSNKLSNSGHP